MRLTLREVPVSHGSTWVRQGFALWWRQPLAYCGLFGVFLFVAMLLTAIPWVGALLVLGALPVLTLGFMIATHAAQQGQTMGPSAYLLPFRSDALRRTRLLQLCALYAVLSALILLAADAVDGGRFERLQILLASGETDAATRRELDALMASDELALGLLVRFGLAALLALPFWHAPALVWWGRQGVMQSLFTSGLACWKTKGAMLMCFGTWAAVVAGLGTVAGIVVSALGSRSLLGVVALPIGLIVSTAFYVSLYAMFARTFAALNGPTDAPDDAVTPPSPDEGAEPPLNPPA